MVIAMKRKGYCSEKMKRYNYPDKVTDQVQGIGEKNDHR